jgi:hypothetical protein
MTVPWELLALAALPSVLSLAVCVLLIRWLR